MACPHVAGVMAKYLSNMPSSTTPDQLMYHVHNLATQNVITDEVPGTPDLLVFKDCKA
jgi:subtilisin family serine protease